MTELHEITVNFMTAKKTAAIIAAAGSGTRMGGVSKPNIKILGKTLFEYVLDAFDASDVDEIVVVCSEDNKDSLVELAKDYKTPIKFTLGGKTRAESVFKGISLASDDIDVVCVHDCARPFITKEIIEETIMASTETGASCVCSPVTDTVKYVDPETNNISTPKRENLFAVQTPQCFKKQLYFDAVKSVESIHTFTDETSLLESINIKVNYVKTNKTNMKLTSPDDVPIAEFLIRKVIAK